MTKIVGDFTRSATNIYNRDYGYVTVTHNWLLTLALLPWLRLKRPCLPMVA
jgi:hypothetical protein